MGNARLYPYTDRGATPDFYVEHMRKTMAWIHEKIADHRREPSHKGYGVETCSPVPPNAPSSLSARRS